MKWESLRGSSPVFYFEHAAEAESSVSVINEFVSFSLVWRMKKWFSFVMVLICVWSPIVLSVSRALIKYRSSFCVFSVSFRLNRRNGISICRGEVVNVCRTNKRRQIELGVSGGWILCGVEIYVWKYNRDIDILWVCWWHAGLRQTMALMISSKRVHQSVAVIASSPTRERSLKPLTWLCSRLSTVSHHNCQVVDSRLIGLNVLVDWIEAALGLFRCF